MRAVKGSLGHPALRESRFQREGARIPTKGVKVQAQVEQRSIQPGAYSTLNLDLCLDLPLGCPQFELATGPRLLKE
jgi:hypothetical protein